MNTSYKEMLRNRLPEEVDLALKWCKAKERWLNYAYNTYLRICTEKELRYHQVRSILGIAKGQRGFDFHKNIEWDNLTNEEEEYWTNVETWVDWFQNNIWDVIKDMHDKTKSKKYIIAEYFSWLDEEWSDKLYDYIKNI